MPRTETIDTWFQRSGSIVVFISLFSEYLIFSIHKLVFMTGIYGEHLWPMRLKYGKIYTLLSLLSFCGAAFGTVIWGYGDIFV